MYDIALAVAACLRVGTRADVAWVVEAGGVPVSDPSRSVAFTPGGGRLGSIDGGPLDAGLVEHASRWDSGRLVRVEVTALDAMIAGLEGSGTARCLIVPAAVLPAELWDLAAARRPFALVCRLDADTVTGIEVVTEDTVAGAGEEVRAVWDSGGTGSSPVGQGWVSVFRSVTRLVVVGRSPIVTALTRIAGVLGWDTRFVDEVSAATGMIATLTPMDKVVVAAHDLELAGAALLAALDGPAGYIGSVGSRRMQENRADWLAYRGVTDLSRLRGPAGLDIGAETPGEIAVSILAEAIAEGSSPPGG